MLNKKGIISVVVSSVVMFALGGLWHMHLLGAYYDSFAPPGMTHDPQLPLIYIGYFLMACCLTYLFTTSKNLGQYSGLLLGALIGFLWVSPYAVVMIGAFGKSLEIVVVDGLYHVVEGAIGGFIVHLVHQKLS